MASTLFLDAKSWDLAVDIAGDIAVADASYALAQDALSAAKLYRGELYYDTTQGVPYLRLLGKKPNAAALRAYVEAAALTVPGVEKAKCVVTSISNRVVSGQLQVTGAGTTTTVVL